MSHLASEIYDVTTTETLNVAIDYTGKLDSGELLTGTPTVTEETTSDLTITNVKVNTATLTINSVSVVAGKAVQFSFSGQLSGNQYRMDTLCTTDATPAQVRNVDVRVNCKT